MLLREDLSERGEVRVRRQRSCVAAPAGMDRLERAQPLPGERHVAVTRRVEEREPLDVTLGQAACAAELRATARCAVGRAVGLGAVHEAAQLDERAVALLDTQVDHAFPGLALGRHDEDRRTAAAAPVAAGRLGSVERREQPLRERALGALERRAHLVPRALGGEHVPLRRPVGTAHVPGGRAARRTRVLGDGAGPVDDRDLPRLDELVVGAQTVERFCRRRAGLEQLEPAPPVAAIGERLRRDRADTGTRPRDGRAGVERLRLDADADLAGRAVTRDDRVRHALKSYACTPIDIDPTYPAPLFFTVISPRLPPLTKIMSCAFVTSGVPRAAYGAFL